MTALDYTIIAVKVLVFAVLCVAASPLRPMRFSIVVLCVILVAGCTPLQRKVVIGASTIIAIGMIKANEPAPTMTNIPGKPDCINKPETCR